MVYPVDSARPGPGSSGIPPPTLAVGGSVFPGAAGLHGTSGLSVMTMGRTSGIMTVRHHPPAFHGLTLPQVGPGLPRVRHPGKNLHCPDQEPLEPAGPHPGLFPRRGSRLRGNRVRSCHRVPLHGQGESRRGGYQRQRSARPGGYRSPGRQAGHGGQGGAVQEVRRHRRLRSRNRRGRPGAAGGNHCRAGTHVRRHQPRRHQGAGLFPRRAGVATAPQHPGVPR